MLSTIHAATSSFFSPFVSGTVGIGIGPPGEFGNLAVNISTPSSVTSSVCSEKDVSSSRSKRGSC